MHQYKIIARILLIFPIITFAFALPLGTHHVRGDVVPRADVAITMFAKRGGETEEQGGMYFERLSGKSDSDIAGLKGPLPEAPGQGSIDPPQPDTSGIQQVPSAGPEPSDASLEHYMDSPGSEASLKHYVSSPGSEASLNHFLLTSPQPDTSLVSTDDSSYMPEAESIQPVTAEKPKSKTLLKSLVSKLKKVKFWRRISGTGSIGIRDAVNTAQRNMQGPVDTGTYVSASSPESSPRITNVPTLWFPSAQ